MELTSGIVCVLDGYNRPAGTGFVVSTPTENLIITCAHVLGEPRPERITIVFQATGEQREAKLLDQWWRPESAEDVAVLQVVGDLPEQVQPFLLGTAAGTRGHTIDTFGFPNVGEVEGVLGKGEVLGLGPKTKAGQPLLQVRSTEITSGFSGAPLLDEVRQRVVGMVVIVARPDATGKLVETAFATPTETLQTVCPILLISDICPYRNLDAFTEADAAFFFGRKRVVDILLDSLKQEPRFLAIFGPSGSGKSSVVQAGLLPQLRAGRVPGSDHWQVLVTRPTDHVFEQVLSHSLQETRKHMVLIIDQFEELFVAFSQVVYQEIVIHLTRPLESSSRITLILVMRDDFYSHFAQQETLVQWSRHRSVQMPPTLKRDEVLAMIQEPARAVGLHLQDGLTEAIADDVLEKVAYSTDTGRVGSSSILPLLEFALTQLWERRQDAVMTRAAYEVMGGVTGALAQWADREFYSLHEQQRALSRRIFTDLVYVGNESQGLPDSRQRRSLVSLARRDDERESIQYIVERLIQARLLVVSRDDRSKEETVEIIHEALLHEWGQLKEWIREDRRFLRWYQKFQERFQEWVETNALDVKQRDPDRLLHGRDLSEAEDWLQERGTDINREEQDFIRLSRAQRAREEEHLKTLLEESERQRRIAEEQRKEAQRQQQIALARSLASQAELLYTQYPLLLERSVLLAVESLQRFPSPEAERVVSDGGRLLRRRLATLAHQDYVTAVTFSSDGRLLATASADHTAGIWEVSSGRRLATLAHQGAVYGVAFSSDRRLLGTASDDHTAGIWEVSSGRRLASLAHQDGVYKVVFSPDGRLLATASGGEDSTAGIWEVSSGRRLASLAHQDSVQAVAFSPAGQLLATASFDGTAGVWEVSSGRQMASLAHQWDVYGVAFSPDGRLLATASGSTSLLSRGPGSADLWEVSSGHRLASLEHQDCVREVAFSPDGRLLATASGNIVRVKFQSSLAEVWEVNSGHRLASLAHLGLVTAVAFSPDGQLLATASFDGTAGVWEVSSGRRLAILPLQVDVRAVAFSPDGRLLATASGSSPMSQGPGSAEVWEMSSGHRLASLEHQGQVQAVAFSPDGRLLATAGRVEDGTTVVCEVSSGHRLASLAHQNDVHVVAFSPDGRLLATAGGNMFQSSLTEVWEVSGGDRLASLAHQGAVYGVAFSPDGRLLATAGGNRSLTPGPGLAEMWEVSSGHRLASLQHQDRVQAVAFSPDGRLLATASDDGKARVLEVSSGKLLATFPHQDCVRAVAFSPDGHLLATASGDNTARVWEVSSRRQMASLAHQDAVNEVAFSPDGRLLATACEDKTVEVWEVSSSLQFMRLTQEESVAAVAFSPDGRYLTTASRKDVRFWLYRREDLIADVQTRLNRNLAPEEWRQYLGEEPYHKTVPHLPSGISQENGDTLPSTIYCNTCGAANRPQARFCCACGNVMLAGSAASSPPPTAQGRPALSSLSPTPGKLKTKAREITQHLNWQVVPSPHVGSDLNYVQRSVGSSLQGVAVVSASDIWAVGRYINDSGLQALIEHWDGTSWQVVPSPNVGSDDNFLHSVAAVSASDIWAVGRHGSSRSQTFQTLIEHWDGISWQVVPSPNVGLDGAWLQGLAVVSATDIWAVGAYTHSGGVQALIEHWDGISWQVVLSPNVGSGHNSLHSVAAVSASDIWAVGRHGSSDFLQMPPERWDGQTLIERWDGTSWQVMPSPSVRSSDNSLDGVAVVAANDIWAVGCYAYNDGVQALIEHWDGTSWQVVPSPNVESGGTWLQGVAVVSTGDIWAVGRYINDSGVQALIEHWDGISWRIVPSPNVGSDGNSLEGLAVVSASDIWAVGIQDYSSNPAQPLIEHGSR
jgi:WD40 repeat protein